MSEPRPLLDKLGVKPGARVAVLRVDDAGFMNDLRARMADVARGRPKKESDVIIVLVEHRKDLGKVGPLQRYLKPNGAIWVIRPKGSPVISEIDVIEAGKSAGLVDNKIASFSDTLSAMRLVIPVARRTAPPR